MSQPNRNSFLFATGKVVALIVVACVLSQTTRALDDAELTPKDRLEVFEKVWKEINENYYDPTFKGVDWQEVHRRYLPLVEAVKTDADFYTLINKMAGELHDAHTRILSPALLANLQAQRRPSLGFRVEEVEGKQVVTSVIADSDAARAGIEPGMIVLTIDDQPVLEKITEVRKAIGASSSKQLDETRVYATAFGGPPGTTVKLRLQRTDGSTFEASVTRRLLETVPKLRTQVLPSGHAYFAFDQFTPSIANEIKEALQKLKSAPGLIIDVRENNGGSAQALYPLTANFYNSKTLFLRTTTRTGKQLPDSPPLEIFLGKQGEQLYAGPVVILVGPRSGSTAELFAAGMQETKRASVVGSQSCGCAVGIDKQRKLKGGGILEISEVLWLTPAGRKIEGNGVTPDRVVSPTIDDLQKRRDPVLEAAEKLLRELSGTK
jgi:carboxyl-terminal processing protease